VSDALRTHATALLQAATTDDPPSLDRLLPLIYDELRAMARHQLAGERRNHTLQTTALVHETYLRLIDQTQVTRRGRAYFFAAAARAMRQVLVDHARRRRAKKRGGGQAPLSLEEDQIAVDAVAAELIDLDEALTRLAELNPRPARVVECRFFGGMTTQETAEALDVSLRTVKSDWALAKAWLHRELKA
jgi:RNA polymerase sigma factor (TIGR02999 family)